MSEVESDLEQFTRTAITGTGKVKKINKIQQVTNI